MGGAPRSRRLAQPGAERGAADSRRPGAACFPGKMLLLFSFDLAVFVLVFVVWHLRVSSTDGRSWSTTPATGTAPSTR
jgi:hypothetical protein